MLEHLPEAIGRLLSGVRPGMDALVMARIGASPSGGPVAAIELTSTAFAADGPIPAEYTDDGDGISPPLAWTGVPEAAACLALIVEDADSPTPRPLVHLVAAPLERSIGGFAEGGLDEDATGRNSFLSQGWLPPDPPPGHGAHRYAFQLFALDATIEAVDGRAAFERAIEGHVIGVGCLVGTFERAAE